MARTHIHTHLHTQHTISISDLRSGQKYIYNKHPSVSVLFSHICNFDDYTNQLTPMNVLRLLNNLFSCFDVITTEENVYKVSVSVDKKLLCLSIFLLLCIHLSLSLWPSLSRLCNPVANTHPRSLCRWKQSVMYTWFRRDVRTSISAPLTLLCCAKSPFGCNPLSEIASMSAQHMRMKLVESTVCLHLSLNTLTWCIHLNLLGTFSNARTTR